jgi:hypothetical protein
MGWGKVRAELPLFEMMALETPGIALNGEGLNNPG